MISIGFIVGIVVTVVLTVLSIAAVLGGRRMCRSGDSDGAFFGGWLIALGAVVLVCTLGFGAWGFHPYDMEYHRWKHVTGEVEQIQARLLGDGNGGTNQSFAVRMRGDGGTYRCDDSRCSLVKPGDHLSLWCIREYEYASTPGWGCRFDTTTPAGAR